MIKTNRTYALDWDEADQDLILRRIKTAFLSER